MPLEDFRHNNTSVHVIHGEAGCALKSSYLDEIEKACKKSEGLDSIKLSDMSKLIDVVHQVVKKWGKSPPARPYILVDVARGFSGKLSQASFWGAIETLMTAVTDGKYGGGELQWIDQKPVIVVVSNTRPIIGVDAKGKELDKPLCHLSAHRLIGNVYSMELGAQGYELVRDNYCDQLAIKVREVEERKHAAQVAQCKSGTLLTREDLFKKYVVSGDAGKFVMDASAPRAAWVEYTTLHLAFKPFAPEIGLKGPGCLSKLMAEWFKDELADGRLVCINKVRTGDRNGPKVLHFSFRRVPPA